MRGIRLTVLAASCLVAALLPAPPAWAAVTPVTFTGPTNFAVGDGPNSVAAGDFNGDSDADLAVANEFTGNVSVLLGAAGGGFSAATSSPSFCVALAKVLRRVRISATLFACSPFSTWPCAVFASCPIAVSLAR